MVTLAGIFPPGAESPLTLLREYSTALRALLHGETVTIHGRYVSLDEVKLDWPPDEIPPLLVGGIRPRTVTLAGQVGDGLILAGGQSPDDFRAAIGHFRSGRAASAEPGKFTVFVAAPADSESGALAATVREYASAGATHVALLGVPEDQADPERFVTFLGREVAPLVS